MASRKMPRTGNGANAIASERMRDRVTDRLADRKELISGTGTGNLARGKGSRLFNVDRPTRLGMEQKHGGTFPPYTPRERMSVLQGWLRTGIAS